MTAHAGAPSRRARPRDGAWQGPHLHGLPFLLLELVLARPAPPPSVLYPTSAEGDPRTHRRGGPCQAPARGRARSVFS